MHYSEIVAEGNLDALKVIAEEIVRRLNVRVLKAPAPGMVMVRHVDPLEKTRFAAVIGLDENLRALPEGFEWTCDNVGQYRRKGESWTPYKVWRV